MQSSSRAAPERVYRYLPGLAASILALALYAFTAAPWITWANDGDDGGDLIAAAMTWGVPHPSGYPTYCLLGRLFALLPLGSIARRFNLFSAVMAAATVGLTYLSALRLMAQAAKQETWRERTIALLASLAFAVSPTFWSQATIAEVYAPQAFFVALCLYLALHRELLKHPGYWASMGLALGLGLGMHLTVLFLLPGLALLLERRKAGAPAGLCSGNALRVDHLPLPAPRRPRGPAHQLGRPAHARRLLVGHQR